MLRPLLVLLALLGAMSVRAGHYQLTYAGGVTVNSGGGQDTYHNQQNIDAYGSNGGTFASCGGEITATFTWEPDYPGETSKPAPPVLMREWCVASYAWDDGYCSNSFGDSEFNKQEAARCRTR